MPEGPATYSQLRWRRSRSCINGACVEVAASGELIFIADSKTSRSSVLSYTNEEFREFLDGAKNGDFDDLVR